jgi:hypothetical protein
MTYPVARQLDSPLLQEAPTITEDLSLRALVPKRAGTGRSCPLHEFFESVESAALVGNWSDGDKVRITCLKLTDTARQFFNTSPDLRKTDVTWDTFKTALQDRFTDPRTDQYH